MNRKKTILTVILILVLIVGISSLIYRQPELNTAPEPMNTEKAAPQSSESPAGEEKQYSPAPDFTVYDANGGSFSLDDFSGKPTVLNFWASWCGPCRMEMPDFDEKYLESGNEINFMMINMTDGSKETVEIAGDFISHSGYSFPVYYDTAMEAAMNYGVYSLPTTYFIDAEGYVIAQATGAIDAETLQRGIDLIS